MSPLGSGGEQYLYPPRPCAMPKFLKRQSRTKVSALNMRRNVKNPWRISPNNPWKAVNGRSEESEVKCTYFPPLEIAQVWSCPSIGNHFSQGDLLYTTLLRFQLSHAILVPLCLGMVIFPHFPQSQVSALPHEVPSYPVHIFVNSVCALT